MDLPPDKIIRSRAEQLGIRSDELKYLINERGPYVGVPHLTSEERYLLESYRISERGDKNSRDDRTRKVPEMTKSRKKPRSDDRRMHRRKKLSEKRRQREKDIHERNIRDGKEDLLIALNQIDEFRNIPYEIKMEVAYQEYTGDLSVDIDKSKRVLREYLQRTGLAAENVVAIGVRDPRVVMADHVLEGTPVLVHEPELEPEPEPETKPEEIDLVAEQMRRGREAGGLELAPIPGETPKQYHKRLKKYRKNKRNSCCGSRPREESSMKKKKRKKQTRRRKSKQKNKRKPKQTRRYKKMKH